MDCNAPIMSASLVDFIFDIGACGGKELDEELGVDLFGQHSNLKCCR